MNVIACPAHDESVCTVPAVASDRFLAIRSGETVLVGQLELVDLAPEAPDDDHLLDVGRVAIRAADGVIDVVEGSVPKLAASLRRAGLRDGRRIAAGVFVLCQPCGHVWVAEQDQTAAVDSGPDAEPVRRPADDGPGAEPGRQAADDGPDAEPERRLEERGA